MKDATLVTLGGYAMATAIVLMMLYTDGTTAAITAAAVASAGAGVGAIIAKKVS